MHIFPNMDSIFISCRMRTISKHLVNVIVKSKSYKNDMSYFAVLVFFGNVHTYKTIELT